VVRTNSSADGTQPGTMGDAAPLRDILCACFLVPFQFLDMNFLVVGRNAGNWAIGGILGRVLLPFTRCQVVDDLTSS